MAAAVATAVAAALELFTMGLYRARWEGVAFVSFGLRFLKLGLNGVVLGF